MQHQILIIAPYPDPRFVSEGWMSRIRSIDRIFLNIPRAYINFGDHHRKDVDGHAIVCEEKVVQYNLNANEPSHQLIFDQLLQKAKFAYVHTVHLAIYIVPWLPTGKIIVDIHGIVPEEELMLGRPQEAERFSPVEKEVLMNCKYLVTVTHAMKKHLIKKYPSSTSNFIILPIFEDYNRKRKVAVKENDDRLKIVYAGGSQVWQNIDLMLELAGDLSNYVDFTFLSHDKEILFQKAQNLQIRDNITIRSAAKNELPSIYAQHDFGFVLRTENPVNTVSCPTKLSEYLDFGIIPIVKYASLGDFERYGYHYITEADLRSYMLPDFMCRNFMIQQNYQAIQKLIGEFATGSAQLLAVIA